MANMKKKFDAAARLPLHGKRVAFTGSLSAVTRRQASAIARELGATPTGSVSANTDYVVAGADAGKKLQQAANRSVPIISEDAFFGLVRKQRKIEKKLRGQQP